MMTGSSDIERAAASAMPQVPKTEMAEARRQSCRGERGSTTSQRTPLRSWCALPSRWSHAAAFGGAAIVRPSAGLELRRWCVSFPRRLPRSRLRPHLVGLAVVPKLKEGLSAVSRKAARNTYEVPSQAAPKPRGERRRCSVGVLFEPLIALR